MVELYVEYVIIDNCVIDYSILRLIEMTLGIKIKKLNKFLVCTLGTICAFILPYLYALNALLIAFRLSTSIVLVLIIKRYKNFKNFATYYLLFMTYTFLIGGACLGIINILGIEYTASSLIMYSFEFPLGLFVLIFMLMIKLIMRCVKIIKNKLKASNYLYDITICDNGEEINCVAFLDSGNNISYENNGVIIISIGTFLKLYKDIDVSSLILNKNELKLLKGKKFINIGGIGKNEKYLSFIIDKMIIGKKYFIKPRLAVIMKNFQDFDCILHKDFVEGII